MNKYVKHQHIPKCDSFELLVSSQTYKLKLTRNLKPIEMANACQS